MSRPAPIRRRRPAAFARLELLVIVLVVALLALLMWSRRAADFQRVRKEWCEANLQNNHRLLAQFASDHEGQLPRAPAATTAEIPLAQLALTNVADTASFLCPGTPDAPSPGGENFATHKISYAYYMGAPLADATSALMSDRQINVRAKKTGDYIFSRDGQAPGANHQQFGGNVLFRDGHVEPSAPKLLFDLPLADGVQLLNPQP